MRGTRLTRTQHARPDGSSGSPRSASCLTRRPRVCSPCRRVTDPLPLPETVPAMKKIKVLATTAALTAPILLPTVAQAKATWT